MTWTPPARHLWPTLLVFDAYAGLLWLLGAPHRWSGVAYEPFHTALTWLPDDWQLRVAGAGLLGLALLALAAWMLGRAEVVRVAFAVGVSFWSFWTLLFAWAGLAHEAAGLLAPGLTALAASMHYHAIRDRP